MDLIGYVKFGSLKCEWLVVSPSTCLFFFSSLRDSRTGDQLVARRVYYDHCIIVVLNFHLQGNDME